MKRLLLVVLAFILACSIVAIRVDFPLRQTADVKYLACATQPMQSLERLFRMGLQSDNAGWWGSEMEAIHEALVYCPEPEDLYLSLHDEHLRHATWCWAEAARSLIASELANSGELKCELALDAAGYWARGEEHWEIASAAWQHYYNQCEGNTRVD